MIGPGGGSRNAVHVIFKVRFTVVEWPVRGKWVYGGVCVKL
jgi:hypothetical protein